VNSTLRGAMELPSPSRMNSHQATANTEARVRTTLVILDDLELKLSEYVAMCLSRPGARLTVV
jgi:hypothetical protein